jgi:sulfatase modifying factor 1
MLGASLDGGWTALRGLVFLLVGFTVVAQAHAAQGEVAAAGPQVLFMPIEPLGEVDKNLATQITGLLVVEAGKLEGYRVQSFREVEGLLTQEQMKQAAGCDSASCAAELAGALNTDQIVIGTLGKLGQSYLLTLSRITAADAQTAGRSVTKVPLSNEEGLLTEMPRTVKTLFGVTEKAVVSTSSSSDKPAATSADKPAPAVSTSKGPSVGRQLGDAFGALVKSGTSLINAPKGGQTLKSDNGTQPFAWIPAGRVMMGCPEKSKCTKDDGKPHIGESGGFWIHKQEVTVKSYQACVAAGVCSAAVATRNKPAGSCNVQQKRLAHPVNCVNYAEAQAYCEWEGGRLPSSDEWEYAAKTGRPVLFPWGMEGVTAVRANTCDQQCPKYKKPKKGEKALDDGYALTAPVGSYPAGANPWGLQDMSGNVREWSFTEDKSKAHELLGGSYISPATAATTYARGKSPPGKWDPTVGFRCVRLTPRPGSDGNE